MPVGTDDPRLREQHDEGAPAGTGWSHFPHDADVGVAGCGPSMAAAFEQAALAMTAVVADPAGVRPAVAVDLRCEAPAPDLLLVEWLNALVYEMATRAMLFSSFAVHIDGTRLSARAWGEPVDRARHAPAAEVKGATYTCLSVRRAQDGSWRARCVVDV